MLGTWEHSLGEEVGGAVGHLPPSSSGSPVLFFLKFCFQIIIDSCTVVRNETEAPSVLFSQLLLMVTPSRSCTTM